MLLWAVAPVTIGILWSFIYAGDIGTLNALLHDIGLSAWTTAWLGDGNRALTLVSLTCLEPDPTYCYDFGGTQSARRPA